MAKSHCSWTQISPSLEAEATFQLSSTSNQKIKSLKKQKQEPQNITIFIR